MKAVTIKSFEIKCDSNGCDYRDPDATLDKADAYLNKPCPKCGANLLTEKDYATAEVLRATAKWINLLVGELPGDSPVVNASVSVDGSGILSFTLKESAR